MRVVDEKLIINKLGPSYKVCIVVAAVNETPHNEHV